MANSNLQVAKKAKNDEFYTQYEDIEKEMNAYYEYDNDVFRGKTILLPCDDPEWSNFTKYFVANFERFGIRKLISTSYAKSAQNGEATDFEKKSSEYDESKHREHGKVFFMDRFNKDIQLQDNLTFYYLQGDGDFRSEEVCRLRDEADIIITNPPFSLLRNFLAWVNPNEKKFVLLSNINAVTYKEVFPLIKDNVIWAGTIFNKTLEFIIPDDYALKGKGFIDNEGKKHGFVPGICWFTNIDHGKRHEPLRLMTMADNLKYNKKLIKKLPKDENSKPYYPKYDNYDAIECPCVDGIPSDYKPCWYDCPSASKCQYGLSEGRNNDAICDKCCNGKISVPITYLDKHHENQFKIIGADFEVAKPMKDVDPTGIYEQGGPAFYLKDKNDDDEPENKSGEQKYRRMYKRIVIRQKKNVTELLESRLHSSISTVQNNSKSWDCLQKIGEKRLSMEFQHIQTNNTKKVLDQSFCQRGFIQESSSDTKCSGVIGVPITFLDKYCIEQFEIIGMTQRGCHDESLEIKKYDDYWEMRQDGTKTGSSGSKTNGNPNISINDLKHNYFINIDGHVVQSCYQRILIKRR